MILRKGSPFSTIVREWEGDTVFILGGGPSLTQEQFAVVRTALDDGFRVIAVNDSYLLAPWADVLYAADASWHDTHRRGVPKLGMTADEVRQAYDQFPGLRCSIESQYESLNDERIHVLSRADFPIGHTYAMPQAGDNKLVAGMSSLHQALNLTIRAGATKALLLGCDGGPVNGKSHWHGGHQVYDVNKTLRAKPTPEEFWLEMRKSFSAAERAIKASGCEVINCNPTSAIDSFPKMRLEDALKFAEIA